MAEDHPDIVVAGLELKKTGNDIVALLGGREIHPINVRVGGFYRLPKRKDWNDLDRKAQGCARDRPGDVRWTSQLPFPDFEQDYEFVSLSHPDEYPFCEGNIVSNRGLDIPIQAFEDHFIEEHVDYTTSLHSTIRDRGNYHVGPLARYSLNFDKLTPLAQEAARKQGSIPSAAIRSRASSSAVWRRSTP
jgi:sulfhydrogenase subunit alpha